MQYLKSCDNLDVDVDVEQRSHGKKRRSSSTETATAHMTTKEDEKEGTREPGRNPFPVSRVQRILKADTVKRLTGRVKQSG